MSEISKRMRDEYDHLKEFWNAGVDPDEGTIAVLMRSAAAEIESLEGRVEPEVSRRLAECRKTVDEYAKAIDELYRGRNPAIRLSTETLRIVRQLTEFTNW